MEQAPDSPDPRIGMLLLGKYRVVRKIGEGGMGAVYEARHELVGRRVAVKCLHARFAADPQVVARFHREALASNAVQNEHIVDVYDMDQFPDGSPFLAMEFLEGRELASVIEKDGPLPASRVVHIFAQICRALGAAHAKGIVHRDLKPENVFLVRRGSDEEFVKVLDFGIAKMREHAESLSGGLTKTGVAMGTPFYMAPEQAQGLRTVDSRVDIYALGVILFEVLTGVRPFDAASYPALMVKILTEEPPRLRALRPELPVALEEVVARALAKKPEERFQSMEELGAALAPFAHGASPVVVDESPVAVASEPASAPPGSGSERFPQPAALPVVAGPAFGTLVPPVPTRRRTLLLLGAAALGLVLATGVALVLHRSAPPRDAAVEIAAGGTFTCARRASGAVGCWGASGLGQLGADSTSESGAVVQGLVDVVEISAGTSHACARRASGTVACWGDNALGQLGDGTTTARAAPVTVSGVAEVVEISVGDRHSCARRGSGAVVCWGDNGSGQLGNATTIHSTCRSGHACSPTPVVVSDLVDAVEISAGNQHTCARRASGAVVCWGEYGDPTRLVGLVSEEDHRRGRARVSAVAELTDAVELTAGHFHTCARRASGAVVCWGRNSQGELGDGTTARRTAMPVLVAGLTDAVELSAGDAHTCARRASGAVICWGENGFGQLGDGTTTGRSTPVRVAGLAGAVEISAGNFHSCARRASGVVACWGSNEGGELGDRTTIERHAPVTVVVR